MWPSVVPRKCTHSTSLNTRPPPSSLRFQPQCPSLAQDGERRVGCDGLFALQGELDGTSPALYPLSTCPSTPAPRAWWCGRTADPWGRAGPRTSPTCSGCSSWQETWKPARPGLRNFLLAPPVTTEKQSELVLMKILSVFLLCWLKGSSHPKSIQSYPSV